MAKAIILFILSVFLTGCLCSCKLTEKNITGSYGLQYFPKTIIRINPGNTFEFLKNRRNHYLLPYDHPDENYFITKGTWVWAGHQKIILTSAKDSLIYPLGDLKRKAPSDSAESNFTFFDAWGDTVKILYVQYSDGSSFAPEHDPMDYYTENLAKKDTLEFHFYGYRPWVFIGGHKENADYSITLKPEFKPLFFQSTEFLVRHNRLTDVKRHAKFRRVPGKLPPSIFKTN